MMNILNGGAHANNNIDIQEFMVLPIQAPNFSEAVRYCVEIYHALAATLKQNKFSTAVGDEGGFAPDLGNNESAIEYIIRAIETTGLIAGKDIYLGLDIAASELYQQGAYHISGKPLTVEAYITLLTQWVNNYPIITIEDAMDENDWQGWQQFNAALGHKIQVVGDDLFVTDEKLLQKGIDQKAANAILIKLNQIGTLTETLNTIHCADKNQFNAVISHRSGETEDTFIADLSVAMGMGQIKTGAPARTDRTAKYNQLLRIAENNLPFAGEAPFKKWLSA